MKILCVCPIFIPYERPFSVVFWEEEWLVGAAPSTWNFNHRMLPLSPQSGSKTQNGRFRCKIALRLKKVCCKISLCENCQRQSCKAFIGLTIRAKMIGGGDPCYLKFWVKMTALERNRRFSIYFRCSASAVTPSEQSSINTNRKSTTVFPMSPRWTSYVVPMPLKGAQKRKTAVFPAKIAFRLKKVCYKVFVCANF